MFEKYARAFYEISEAYWWLTVGYVMGQPNQKIWLIPPFIIGTLIRLVVTHKGRKENV